nr:unnamed protein product [Digitaria exilis]
MAAVTSADLEAVDFDLEDDDLMDEDVVAEPLPAAAPASRLRSTIAGDGAPRKTKGRGFREDRDSSSVPRDSRSGDGGRGDLDSLGSGGGPAPIRSIEGWIVLVTGVHEEAQEDDLHNAFAEFGQGYALVEYENFEEAQAAIKELDGTVLHTEIINVDWAFSSGPAKHRSSQKRYFLLGSRTMSLNTAKSSSFKVSNQEKILTPSRT